MSRPGMERLVRSVPRTRVGGLPIAVLDREQTADLMIELANAHESGERPAILTSANGEVISRCAASTRIAQLFQTADVISADGQPMVLVSRLLHRWFSIGAALPERVATTDLFHDVARHADASRISFYFLGATEEENRLAVQRVKRLYPELRIAGRSHGYLKGDALTKQLAEINTLGPDILWLAMGVPAEQEFCERHAAALTNVAVIKTSGGLFNFLSGTRKRAPAWMQNAGLEWVFRLSQEPRRLAWRYTVTNPHALFLLVTRSD